MPGRNSVITAIITADTTAFDRAIGETDTRMGNFGRNVGRAALGIGVAVGGAIAIGRPLVAAASTWEEAASRVDTIFGDASDSVRAFADTSAEEMAVSSTEALAAAGDFAGFFDSLTGDELADMSTDLVAAASDFASFNNLTNDEALGKFRSALAGSSEVMRQYGIDTSQAAIEQKAAEMGLGDLNGQLTEQEKNLARSAILLDEGNAFMGDYARTSDSLANQQRELSARFSDVQVELGDKLLPVALAAAEIALGMVDAFSEVIDVFSEEGLAGVLDMIGEKFEWFNVIRDIVEDVTGRIADNIASLISIFDGIIDFITSVFTGDWSGAWEAIQQIFTGVWDYMTSIVSGAWALIQAGVSAIIDGVTALWDWSFLSDLVEGAIDGVVGFFTGLPGRLRDLLVDIAEAGLEVGGAIIGGIADGISGGIDTITSTFGDIIDAFRGWWNRIDPTITLSLPSWLGGASWTSPDLLPDIPELAKGGIVTRPTLAWVGEAGPEAVIPLNRPGVGSMMGDGQPVHVTVELDGRVLAEAVVAANRRSGGTLLVAS